MADGIRLSNPVGNWSPSSFLCPFLGHDWVRYPERDGRSLHPDWGYLECRRCVRGGYFELDGYDYSSDANGE